MKKMRLAAAVMSLITVFGSSVYAKTFKDVTKNGQFKWIYTELDSLSEKKIFGGYPEGDFRPDNPVSFLEILQVIKNIKNPSEEELQEARANFSAFATSENVPSWAMDAVVYSLNNNTITSGTLSEANKRGFLRAENTVYPNRNSVTVYFGRAFGFSGNGDRNLLKHSDLASVPQVTLGYLSELVGSGIFSATGSEGYFNGTHYIRRAEIVSIAYKAINYLANTELVEEDEIENIIAENLDVETVVEGEVESVDEVNKTIRVLGADYKLSDETRYIGENTPISNLRGSTVELKHIANTVTELNVKKTELKTNRFTARVLNSTVDGNEYRTELKILVSDSKELVSGSDVFVKLSREFKQDDIIVFDARVENGNLFEVNIKR